MTRDEAARKEAQLQGLMGRIRQARTAGRCVICGQPVAHWQGTDEARMVCSNRRCFYMWVLPGSKEQLDAAPVAPDEESTDAQSIAF